MLLYFISESQDYVNPLEYFLSDMKVIMFDSSFLFLLED